MPSVKNPNGYSKNRLTARAATARKKSQKSSAAGRSKINKADQKRGAGGGLLPTSGPRAAISSKKQRKLDRKTKHALQRRMEADGEIEMKDATGEAETGNSEGKSVHVDMDTEEIS
ncbi:hypothetical protein BJ170DRAFT_68115 [Xylariales sp. AK1849]|nr:hypothetical protein BJ170DRAFT_68115 [Xylariales sp. AK1849]